MYKEDTKRINFGLDMELYEIALKKSKEENRSFANFIVNCISTYIEQNPLKETDK